MIFSLVSSLLLAAPPPSPPPSPSPAPRVDELALKGLAARPIGPAVMGGRISELALDPKDPFTFYVALGTGGILKTTDDGVTFSGVFENEKVAAVGAVAVAPSDPKVVWAGTGEANDRNSSSWGDGVYRSTDGGASWTNVGLKTSRTVARIVVHPQDPATAWVAATGDLWTWGGERGIYRTTDAGKTWTRVLAAPAPDEGRAGGGDLAIDPSNPDVLYAALYARQRRPWTFVYGPDATEGRDAGGLFKSTDGGRTWRKLGGGLPGRTGRIGLAVHVKDPRVVYAIVQSDEGGTSAIGDVRSRKGGVFRSDDAGETWKRVNALNPRPFYFSQVRVDPENADRVYVLGFALHVSEDGGASFREDRSAKIHPDLHALAFDPRWPRRMLLGTDGGLYRTANGGESWEFLNRFAGGEFYRISVDQSKPYRICGGLQDNLNWVGPSRTFTRDGIVNADWVNIGGGDGFYCVFDPDEPQIVYTESQSGYVHRMDLRSGQVKELRPEPTEGQPRFRFHWNSPLIGSRHHRGVLYLAGNRVFRMRERGEQWEIVSPDLSAADPARTLAEGSGAETYAVVYTLAESPRKAGLLWAGTDDGKVWVTENDGGLWNDLTANLPPAARGQWVSRIEASSHDPNVAYLAVDAHRSGILSPLAYRTGDLGRTWQSIAGSLPADGPVKVVREDLRNPNVLYAGTEFALFVSLDRGQRWSKLGGLPTVAVDDIVQHPRDNDLVVATHGRSLYVLDDVRALQDLTPEVAAKDAHLFPPRPALAVHLLPGFSDWSGKAEYRGKNPPDGATFTYHVKAWSGEGVKIAVANAAGVSVARLTGPGTPGLNRVTWDLKPSKELLVEYGSEGSRFVRPGEYTVTLTYGTTKVEQKLQVEAAPGVETR